MNGHHPPSGNRGGNRTRLMVCFGQYFMPTILLMTDQEKWSSAVAAVSAEFDALPSKARNWLSPMLRAVRELKQNIHRYAEVLDGSAICAECGGQCCATGKHHFTVVDLLVFLAGEKPVVAPRFSSGWCPFLGDDGCIIEPEFRPYNCVTFNCDRIDCLLQPFEREAFMDTERKLRSAYRAIEEFFDNTFMQGLIITCERDLLRDRKPVLGLGRAAMRDGFGEV